MKNINIHDVLAASNVVAKHIGQLFKEGKAEEAADFKAVSRLLKQVSKEVEEYKEQKGVQILSAFKLDEVKPSKKSLLERQTEATEKMVDILDKILLYVKPTWALENDIKRYSDRD